MFKRAQKQQTALRMALVGPSGSGKTFTALTIAKGLGSKIAVIDSERGSASKYAGDVADFDVAELESFEPHTYVAAIEAAGAAGYPVLVIDSLSHAWMGKGGALEQVDKAAAKSRSGNSFTAWREVTPMHNALVDAILRYPGHVIATMRAKTEWVLEEDNRGKKTPRKIGLAPVQRDGMEYEFDVVADIDHEHRMIVSKSRCPALADEVITRPDAKVAATLRQWLDDGHDPLADVLAQLENATTPAMLASAKEAARKAFRTVTNGRREKLAAAVKAAEERVGSAEPTASPEGSCAAGEASCGEAEPRPEVPKRIADCTNEARLRAFCSHHREAIVERDKVHDVLAQADAIGVPREDVSQWLQGAA